MNTPSNLIPMDVAARVVDSDTNVPLLTDKPFADKSNLGKGNLEKGIHVHWALPEMLTIAKSREKGPAQFPGVPDLWLVVRYNPVSGSSKRTHRAWVVDSIDETVTLLANWQPPNSRKNNMIHTAQGMLKPSSSHFGWGQLDNKEPFDALISGYYPACRKRLGFYDDLSDLGNTPNGKVSYTIVGWYSQVSFDPFWNKQSMQRQRVDKRTDIQKNKALNVTVSKTKLHSEMLWNPNLRVDRLAELSKAEATVLRTANKIQAETINTLNKAVDAMVAAMPVSSSGPQQVVMDLLQPDSMQKSTVCYGSLMDVPLRETRLIGLSSIDKENVFLYPNIQRAMAEVASNTEGTEQQTDWLEMMLGKLGQQTDSFSGVVDLASAQHERTFQSVPGKLSYYARLEIRPKEDNAVAAFNIVDSNNGGKINKSGNYPKLNARSAYMEFSALSKPIPAASQNNPPKQATGPSNDEIIEWIKELRVAFASARQLSASNGKPLDPRIIRVQDFRKNAQPTPQGRSVDGSGPDQAGWWIDMGPEIEINTSSIETNDKHKALAELRRSIGGTIIYMPDAVNLFETPGPRWHRPWSPHLVVYGSSRSYRYGKYELLRESGHRLTRVSGESMIGLRVGNVTVFAEDILNSPAELTTAGLPAVVGELIQEHLLSDAENAVIMAKVARPNKVLNRLMTLPTEKQMVAASRSLWLSQVDILNAEEKSTIDLIEPIGTPGPKIGLQAWRDWYGPLFLDTKYTHHRKLLNTCWTLPAEYIEVVDRIPPVEPDLKSEFTERQIATVSIVKVLKSSLITELSLDAYGALRPKSPSPPDVTIDTFNDMDVVSASLSKLDEHLFNAGASERGGYVQMDEIRLFDTFGTLVKWESKDAGLNPLPNWATGLPARLSCWGRLSFRLQAADDLSMEASQLTSTVCGILLPDFVEQALEVYDSDGTAIGQLTADDPIRKTNKTPAQTLSVKFTLLPWVKKDFSGDDPTLAIKNVTLREFVLSLLAQTEEVPEDVLGWHETGFTAMMRVFDTVRSTVTPSANSSNNIVRLLGEPIVVLNARLFYEVSNSSPTKLTTNPQLVATPPEELPVLRVRVGDVTRPDDGVIGCFLIDKSSEKLPKNGRFAPVSLEAAEKAVLNQVIFKGGNSSIEKINHPFIKDKVSEFDLPANQMLDTVILADPRGSMYATCGLLPRKKIIIPRELIDPVLKRLEPTFAVGPILGYTQQKALVPVLPAPRIEGMEAEFVHDDGDKFPELAIASQLPVAELPPERVRLTEGWVRMFTPKL